MMFENRVGKRSFDQSHIYLLETESSLDVNDKQLPDEKLSLRLDILRESQKNLSKAKRNHLLEMLKPKRVMKSHGT